VVLPGTGPDALILITAFGYGVAVLHQTNRDARTAVAERGEGEAGSGGSCDTSGGPT
jgi:hypothetical protein